MPDAVKPEICLTGKLLYPVHIGLPAYIQEPDGYRGLPPREIGRILNTLGLRVQEGERFQAGRYVSGIYADCDIRLDEFRETGRNVLRAVIPDRQNRFPEDPQCEDPYRLQSMDTEDLYEREGMLS